jgi:integrase
MPTSLQTLLRYRAAHAPCCDSRRVWLFHSHAYFDHAARALWLGTPLAIDRSMLEAVDATLLASLRTEDSYLHWIRRFIFFHSKKHPREMGGPQVEAFLSHLATDARVAASTQNQALSALLFLYREVLQVDLPWLDGVVRAKRPKHVPVVVTENEVRALLAQLEVAGCRSPVQLGDAPAGEIAPARQGCRFRAPRDHGARWQRRA